MSLRQSPWVGPSPEGRCQVHPAAPQELGSLSPRVTASHGEVLGLIPTTHLLCRLSSLPLVPSLLFVTEPHTSGCPPPPSNKCPSLRRSPCCRLSRLLLSLLDLSPWASESRAIWVPALKKCLPQGQLTQPAYSLVQGSSRWVSQGLPGPAPQRQESTAMLLRTPSPLFRSERAAQAGGVGQDLPGSLSTPGCAAVSSGQPGGAQGHPGQEGGWA